MAFTLWELSLLKDNKQKTVLVGYVPDVVATQMSLSMKEVYLSKQSMDHIFQEHPDINGFDLLHIPNALDHGMIVQEKAKPHCLIISYMDPDTHRRFVFAVKTVKGGDENYVTSFRRGRKGQMKSFLKRGILLKKHD